MSTIIGPLHVRRSIFIEATPARVWQEFESFERISRWLNLGHTLHMLEPHLGGRVELSVDIDGEQRFYGGEILRFDVQREMTFDVQWQKPHQWPVPTFWTYRLSALYGGTHVEIFHHGFERLGAAAADNLEGYEGGWDIKHLQALRAVVSE